MLSRFRFLRPVLVSVLAGATLVAYTGLSVPVIPAAAADQATLDVIAGLNQTMDVVDSLGAVGALAQDVPGLALAPGSAAGIGLADLLTKGRDTLLGGATYGGANTLSELVSKIDGVDNGSLADGRTLDLQAADTTVGALHTITVGLTAKRSIDTGVDVASTAPKFAFTAAKGITAVLTLAGSFTILYDTSSRYFRLVKSTSTPSLAMTVKTSIPDVSAVTAGLGILGVELGTGSTFDLQAQLAATFDDPNNDGVLAFKEPDGVGGFRDGELAATGAGAGISGVALTGGSLSSTLKLQAVPSTYINLGTANATVTVGSANLLTTPITVTDTGGTLGAVNSFLNLSPRDLAQGLAEVATTITALQRAGSIDLPFLRGGIDDAVKSTEAIVEFLDAHVAKSTDPTKPGRPDFASLQALLKELVDANTLPSGAAFTIANGTYDGSKVRFDLGISRTAGSAQPMNTLGQATSGSGTGVTYTPTTLTALGQDFSDKAGEALSYKGRQVLVGASSAIIASASGNTLTLDPSAIGNPPPANAWKGGTPADGTSYSISAGDPRTGVVELGNVLGTVGAIKNANAKTAVAMITPSYSVTLPIALDLRPGSTSDCDPGPGTAACPYQLKDPATGLATVITELPLAPDRILLNTGKPLLTADAPLTTKVDVDATVGFVGVKITGDLAVCTKGPAADCTGTPASGDHLFSLGLKQLGDAQNDATLPQIGKALTDAFLPGGSLSNVITTSVKGQAYAALTVDVPGGSGFFGTGPATATITLPDITAPSGVSVAAPDLGKLVPLNFDPSNPLALFGVLLADLQGLQDTIGDLPGGSAGLKTPIPLVGRSLSDLIGSGVSGAGAGVKYGATTLTDTNRNFDNSFIGRRVTVGTTTAVVLSGTGTTLTLSPWNTTPADGSPYEIDSEIQGVVNLLTAAQPPSLQDALALLKNGLGINDTPGKTLSFTVDTSGTDPVLKLNVDWVRSVNKTLPINLSFKLGSADKALIGADTGGVLKATIGGGVKLGLQLPLTTAAAAAPLTYLRVDPTSSISAKASLTGNDLRLATNVGPFQISLGDPNTSNPAGTQLEANFGVALKDSTDTSPVTLSTFAGNLALTMSNGTSTCPGAPSTAALSACAVLPVYVNGAPVSATDNAFVLRLPKDATSLTDAFDLSGTVGGQPRFSYPPDLASKLAAAGLNMLTVGDGLFGYVQFLENALQVASFNGKLPVVGKDLQAGSQFLGDLRTGLQTAFTGAPTNPTAGDIKTFLNDKVRPALPGAPNPLPVTFQCEVYLATPSAPGVVVTKDTHDPAAATIGYAYKIVATVNTPPDDSIPSDPSSVVQNEAVLDATHYNTVSWAPVKYATGYKILRKRGSESTFTQVGTSAGSPFKDDTAAGTSYTAKTVKPKLKECPNDAPADSVTGFTVSVDIGQGNPTASAGCTAPGCLEGKLPLDLGIPGLSFKASDAAKDKVTASLGWKLHLKFGMSRDDGFFVSTQDATTPEFTVGTSVDLPPSMQAQLAFFTIDIAKHAGSGSTPLFKGAFSIDLKDAAGSPDCPSSSCAAADDSRKLTLDKLKASSLGDLVVPKLSAGVNIDWDVKATVDSALPGVGARFLLKWDWSSADPGNVTNLSELAFKDVVIDPGAFIASNIGPIINQLISVFKPVQPIIDTILAPLPVLSDLSKLAGGDDVTIASLAGSFSTLAGGPDITPFIEVLKVIRSLGGLAGTCSGGTTFCVKVGDFDIKKELALNTANSAATAGSLVGTNTPAAGDNPFKQLSDNSGGKLAAATGPALAKSACPNGKRGISFPALEQPTQLFGLLLNRDVEIACFDSGPLALGFQMNLRLGPVYAPPPVYIVISGGASVSLRLAAGFDTYGIRTAVEQGKADAKILDSLYFKTTDTTGAPLPVVQFKGFLAAGASVSAVIIEVGIKGGIELTVNFTWNDPNNDGKFRFNEFLATALNNPICLFNVGGQLDLFITVFITLGISPFSVSFDFELVRVKLLDFSLKPDCTPPPPRLGGTASGVLYLFAGKYGGAAERGNAAWKSNNTADEGWIIRQQPDDPATTSTDERAVVVQALGITETFPDAGGTTISSVVLDGRGYDGKLKVVFNGGGKDQPFDKDTVVFTGNKSDTVRTGSGRSYVDAGPGDDNVSTTDRPKLAVPAADSSKAVVAGGDGKDGITVGNGNDVVLGDGSLSPSTGNVEVTPLTGAKVTLTGVATVSPVPAASSPAAENSDNGMDTISAGLGGNAIWGGGGGDIIGTANDSPLALIPANASTKSQYQAQPNTIVGGSGGDRIKSGSAADFIYTGAKVDPGKDGLGSGDGEKDVNTVDTGTGSDTVYGSNGQDNVATGSSADQSAKVYGGGANDILAGGDGTDELYGGPGDDYVIAEPSTVQQTPTVPDVLGDAYVVSRLNRPSSDSAKILAGGGGRDRLYGGNGRALIYGDRADFTCAKGADPVSDAPAESPTVSSPPDPAVDDANDLILGGSGVDTVNAGGGNDTVYAGGGNDLLCGNAGDDRIYSGSGDDYAYGGSGDDTMNGDGGADFVFGNVGNDTLYGNAGADVLEGNANSDTAFGGTGDDVVVGGTRKAGRPDAGDVLYGDAGEDTLIGDNGVVGTLYDLDAGDGSLGGKDLIYGGAGNDSAFGGLDADEVHGGDGADRLEGNNASDTVFGEAGADNIIGGTSQLAAGNATYPDAGDTLSGGGQDDVIAGDNAQVTNVSDGSPLTKGRGLTSERSITLLDLGTGPATGKYGGDTITGDGENDVILGQRGNDVIRGNGGDDYLEGGQDSDTIDGDDGDDDIVGGEFTPASGAGASTTGQPDAGDTVRGGTGSDVALGDNGSLLRDPAVAISDLTKGRGITERAIQLYDLGDSPAANTSGPDLVRGNEGVDVLLGQGGTDRLLGDEASDYVEGGPDSDWIEGGDGSDDLVGGSSAINSGTGAGAQGQPDAGDVIWGQAGDDVETGDNALVTRVAPYNDLTFRVGAGSLTERRAIRLLDVSNGGILNPPAATRFGGDQLSGQGGVDVLLGQDGPDSISGGSADDYAEGQGGSDRIWGDQSLASAGVTSPVVPWPGAPSGGYDADGGPDGQDDLIGGKSQPGFRDGADQINGNGGSDYVLGDNGTSVRDIQNGATTVTPSTSPLPAGPFTERIYTIRYPASLPVGAAKVRHRDPAQSAPTTRYCTTGQTTCEVAGAFGDDAILGEAGDDFLYGQDGNDSIRAGAGDDDVFGELGDDTLFGDAGNDAILGDRGGVRDVYQTGSNSFFLSVTQVPKVEYTGFGPGTVARVTDLLHDVNGDVFVGSGTQPAMPHAGLNEGGIDRIRGGTGSDSIHAGFGDDLANGDSGGDSVFGDDGADVIWGGKGCDASVDTAASAPYCYPGGVFDPAPHTAAGETVPQVTDYLVGGKGGTSAVSLAGSSGSDVIDWRPRGSYAPGTGCTANAWPVDLNSAGKTATTTVDPCSWFEMTDLNDDVDANNQHHQGVDWQYGGWDRDILQGDQADNGPNEGDRLLDWNGAYNLYTHCNSAYGGYNDVRQHSPSWQDFLQSWVWAQGAGQAKSDTTTAGTSAFVELALVYPGADNAHGSGSAYPSTPGHFDNPNACAS